MSHMGRDRVCLHFLAAYIAYMVVRWCEADINKQARSGEKSSVNFGYFCCQGVLLAGGKRVVVRD
jgi:hypothetical protein